MSSQPELGRCRCGLAIGCSRRRSGIHECVHVYTPGIRSAGPSGDVRFGSYVEGVDAQSSNYCPARYSAVERVAAVGIRPVFRMHCRRHTFGGSGGTAGSEPTGRALFGLRPGQFGRLRGGFSGFSEDVVVGVIQVGSDRLFMWGGGDSSPIRGAERCRFRAKGRYEK